MNLKKIIISTSIALILSTSCFADPKPDRCPNIEVIKYRGLLMAVKDGCSDKYKVAQFDKYGTSAPWTFIIEDIDAKNASDALDKASKQLTSISGDPEVKPIEDGIPGWICEYKTANNQQVYAYNVDPEADFTQLFKSKGNHKR